MTKAASGVFRTQVFSSTGSSLSDVHRFCQDGCSRDACCHGFVLNQNSLSGGEGGEGRAGRRGSGGVSWLDNIVPTLVPISLRYPAVWLAESPVSTGVRRARLGRDWTGKSQSHLWGGA